MRIGIIDCGTNTFNLLIVEVSGHSYKPLFSTKIPVKLGQGAINKGYIAEEPFKRGVEAMICYKNELANKQVKNVYAFATSAVRDARNGSEFTNEVFQKTGIPIQVIDGNREAELIFKGNRMAMKLGNTPCLIMDIGGGSTEFIIGTDSGILWKKSYRLGAARLLELFKPSNPITQDEIRKFNNHLFNELSELQDAVNKFKPLELIGSSGAFDSVVEMIHGELNGEPFFKEKSEYSIQCQQYFTIADKVIASTIDERRKIKGLVDMRVDMMVISCLLINYVLYNFALNTFRVSTYSLKEGVLFELIHEQNNM
jgi:exopolyphosphatase / guanosine-5'-triphosphate,3'-diphosphate pyrophosphatase